MRTETIIAGVGTLLLAAAMTGGTVLDAVQKEGVHLDPATLCPVSGVKDYTEVVVDRTDSLTPEDMAIVHREFTRILASLRKDERLVVFFMQADDVPMPKPVFDMCRPSRATDENWLFGTPKLTERRYEARFKAPLEREIKAMAKPSETSRTAALETIRNVSRLPSFAAATGRRRLVLITDFMENTATLSFYRQAPNYAAFKKSTFARKVAPALSGVHITLVMLPNRRTHRQDVECLSFLEQWVTDSGGHVQHVYAP